MRRFLRKLERSVTGVDADLANSGVRGTAVIRAIEETNQRIGDPGGGRGRDIFQFLLLVTVPDREPYEVVHRQDGGAPLETEVVVYVDPQDPHSLFIDWDASAPAVSRAQVAQQMAGVDMPPSAGASPRDIWEWQLRNGYITQAEYDYFRKNNPDA